MTLITEKILHSIDDLRVQLELYFHSVNINTDRFLRNQLQAHKDNWVRIDYLNTFSKIKKFPPEDIATAAEKAPSIELSPDRQRLRPAKRFEKDPNFPEQVLFLFNVGPEDDHASLQARFLQLGGPVPIKIGCKRDN